MAESHGTTSASSGAAALQDRAAAAAEGIYTPREEIAHCITHGVGAVLSVVALVLLLHVARTHGDAWHVVGFAVFGLSLTSLYTTSTLYHLSRDERRRRFFRRLDHAAIFVLIAGTYTPFLLTNLRGIWGWSLFVVIWGICGTGMFWKLAGLGRHRLVSTAVYLFAGWLMLIAIKPMIATLPPAAIWLLLAGGFFYTAGVAFYLWHRLLYHHAIWHGFVLAGSACHFLAVLLLVLR